MAQHERLERNIATVELMVSEDREKLHQNPDSFSAQLVLASTEGHLADLRHQLQELRNNGAPGDFSWSPFPADFCGLSELIKRLGDETTRLPMASFDAVYSVIDELLVLQDGLSQLRFDRWRKSEPEIDLFLDLLRGMKTQGTRQGNAGG